MRKAISEYLELSNEEKGKIWDNGTFVFDTNVLLNLYRYSVSTRKSLMDALKGLEMVWMPYQVALEFMKRREKTIFETVNRYQELKKDYNTYLSSVINNLRLSKEDDAVTKLTKFNEMWLEEQEKSDLIVEHPNNDVILNDLLDIFDDKTGEPFSEDILTEIYNEGRERYEKLIPPGYKDIKKSDNKEYGDLILWKQMIEHSKENNKHMIFITNDQKEDWWNIVSGKTIGPRIELKKEFCKETGNKFMMYNMNTFLKMFNEKNSIKISEDVLKEVSETRERNIDIQNYSTNNYHSKVNENKSREKIRKDYIILMDKLMYNSALKNDLISDYNNSGSKKLINNIRQIDNENEELIRQKIMYEKDNEDLEYLFFRSDETSNILEPDIINESEIVIRFVTNKPIYNLGELVENKIIIINKAIPIVDWKLINGKDDSYAVYLTHMSSRRVYWIKKFLVDAFSDIEGVRDVYISH